ncbi:MAG: hypothetical protein JO101_03070 [Candidatus Eremiobacteraeota bacterium]|nr:hypothetical protein [Candidatus Eremiobacteraeota bacterium]
MKKAEKPHVLMAFACESVGADPKAPFSFENVVDGIGAPDFPAPTGRWFAVFCFFSDVTRTIENCRVVVQDPGGQIVGHLAVKDLRFTTDNPTSRNVVGMQGFAWPYPGRFLIKFVAGESDELALFPILVQHVPAADETEETERS